MMSYIWETFSSLIVNKFCGLGAKGIFFVTMTGTLLVGTVLELAGVIVGATPHTVPFLEQL